MSILAQDRTQREEGISGLVYTAQLQHHEANLRSIYDPSIDRYSEWAS
ncbi:hypothetical protein [Chamaesiphon polymorphus]|nr:hypothetical protein [Chamaesiphon polymorphus]